MIGNMTYKEVEEVAKELDSAVDIVMEYIKGKNLIELEDFASTVESYAKFLMTTIELNKDADKELADLKAIK